MERIVTNNRHTAAAGLCGGRHKLSMLLEGWWLVVLLFCSSTRAQLNARADFNMNGVSGSVLFSWNPLARHLIINTQGLRGIDAQTLAAGLPWHVHKFPFKLNSPDPCGASSTGGHFDPLGKARAPNYARLCQSQVSMRFRDCEIGDFSGKFGPLQLREYVELTPNISLSGNFGIIGRSLVIHRGGKRWVCANIEPVLQHRDHCAQKPNVNQVRTLVAKFKWPIAGEVFLRQIDTRGTPPTPSLPLPAGQPANTALLNISTVIYSHLYWVDKKAAAGSVQSATAFLPPFATNTQTAFSQPGQAPALRLGIQPFQAVSAGASPSFMWQIESQPVHETAQFSQNPRTRCSGTGRILAPLSSWLGPLSIGVDPNSASTSKTLYTTNNSVFYPVDGFIRRSLIILDPTRRVRIACATIHEVHPATAQAKFADGVGTIAMTQRSEFDATLIVPNLDALFNNAGHYGVRTFSMKRAAAGGRIQLCGVEQTGHLFNPLNVQRQQGSNQSANLYPIGDLSGKFGQLRQVFNFRGHMCDTNLPMFGANSVVGRTVVIEHANSQKPPIACARLDPTLKRNSRLHQARVAFTGAVKGAVLLEQEQFADGQLGDTYIKSYNLRNFNNWQTQGHNYHIHVGRIGILKTGNDPTGQCSNQHAGPHYNPFNASVDMPFYKAQCSPQNPYRCELGDTSKKAGPMEIRGIPQYHIDADLPLIGPFTALGKSMVIHYPNGAGARLACGNVIPKQGHDVIMLMMVSPRQFSPQYFKQRVAGTLGITSQNVLYLRAHAHGQCTAVSFALEGQQSDQHARSILQADLGQYSHDSRCADPSAFVTAAPFTDLVDEIDSGPSAASRSSTTLSIAVILLLSIVTLLVCN